MVYCAVTGCYNHSNKINSTENISYFRLPVVGITPEATAKSQNLKI